MVKKRLLHSFLAYLVYVILLVCLLQYVKATIFWVALIGVALAQWAFAKWGKRLPDRWCVPLRRALTPVGRCLRYIHLSQLIGKTVTPANKDERRCLNCGNTFVGNYCPRCGQECSTSQTLHLRAYLKHAALSLMKFGSGMGRTLIDILWRPGYMIRDYLKGCRIRYASPLLTLIFVLLTYSFIQSDFHIEQPPLSLNFSFGYDNGKNSQDNAPKFYYQISSDDTTSVGKSTGKTPKDDVTSFNYHITSDDSTSLSMNVSKGDVVVSNKSGSSSSLMRQIDNKVDKTVGNWTFVKKLWRAVKKWVGANYVLLEIIVIVIPVFSIASLVVFRKRTVAGRRLNFTEFVVLFTYWVASVLLSLLLLYITANANLFIYTAILLLIVSVRQVFDRMTLLKSILLSVATLILAILFIIAVLALLLLFMWLL